MLRRTAVAQAHNLEATLDLQKDLQDLRDLGLSEEEIEGYLEFYLDNYAFQPINNEVH